MKISIGNMTCSHCAASVERALIAVKGVEKVKVNLKKKTAVVKLKGDVDVKVLTDVIRDAGYVVENIQ